MVGQGTGIWSFIHIEDAAAAAVSALTCKPGVYNITDDDPAPVHDWLPCLARSVKAKNHRTMFLHGLPDYWSVNWGL